MLSFVRKISRHLYVPVGWTLITIILLCLPGSAIPSVGMYGLRNIDKLVHFLLFGFIAMSWTINFSTRYPPQWKKWLIIFCLFSISLGIALEFVQLYFVPNRDFDVWDIFADTLGAIVFSLIIYSAETRQEFKLKKPL
jgi:VanZ family protein